MALKAYKIGTASFISTTGLELTQADIEMNILIEMRVANTLQRQLALGLMPDELDQIRQDIAQEL